MTTPSKPISVSEILPKPEDPSLLFYHQELHRSSGIYFPNWWKEFAKGFIGAKRDPKTNFRAGRWSKPKYVDMTPENSTSGATTIEYWPDEANIRESYLLSGTTSNIISGIMTIMLNKQFGVDFDTWFEGWRNGFPNLKENRIGSNYPLAGKSVWRADPKNKPRFREWSNPAQRGTIGRIIEYWKDGNADKESILISGSNADLIRHILQIEYEGGSSASNKSQSRNWPHMKGQPQIKLYFLGDNKASGEISLRIMDKSDDPKSPLPKISKGDLRAYARSIKDNFATPDLFTWQKGKEVVSYRNRWQGFEGWYLSKNEAAGRALISKLLAITDKVLDESSLRFSTAPATAFPSNPPDITILEESISQDSERPIVDVKFYRAEIILSKLRSPIYLNERARIIYT